MDELNYTYDNNAALFKHFQVKKDLRNLNLFTDIFQLKECKPRIVRKNVNTL